MQCSIHEPLHVKPGDHVKPRHKKLRILNRHLEVRMYTICAAVLRKVNIAVWPYVSTLANAAPSTPGTPTEW